MIFVKPSIEFMDMNSMGVKLIELAARNCYKSEDKIGEGTAEEMVRKLLKRGHEAMIEFGWLCYRVICNRGVTHELVRHRLNSYAQESTRYCNYKGGVSIIVPPWVDLPATTQGHKVWLDEENRFQGWTPPLVKNELRWVRHMLVCEEAYIGMIADGWIAQKARGALPIDVKTEIFIGGNIREWRHFFKMRCSSKAHPQMQEIAYMLLEDAQKRVPIVFDDFPGKPKLD